MLCSDYRRLNAVTCKDTFPLPYTDDLLDQLHGKKIFNTLDVKQGYWQIWMQESLIENTAFVTFDEAYEFRVMPFGLTNVPSILQRLMQKILAGLSKVSSVYVDNVLVSSISVAEHVGHLCQVFLCMQRAGLKLATPPELFLGTLRDS